MNWLAAAIALIVAFAIPALSACRGRTPDRFVAVQFATSLTSLILVLFTFAFDQSSFIDLPLCLAFLNLAGSLLIALVLERWL